MTIRLTASLVALAAATVAAPVAAQTVAPATTPSTRIIVFGDSLSDGGFYRALDPRLPGRFTTNPDLVAPEIAAGRLGLPIESIYLNPQTGTNYAVGGARVTAANGITVPIATQITRFLTTNPTIAPTDLFYVQGGGNDYFAFLAGGGTNPGILTSAATDLAAQVARLQTAGARRIVTMSIQSAGAAPIQAFNQTYANALRAANVNALFVDVDRLFNEILTNPAQFGIVNVTNTACTVSSLQCTRATLVTPNAFDTYARADDVHPTGIVQRIQGQLIASLIAAPDQIANLGFAAESAFRAHRDQIAGPMQVGLPGGTTGVHAAVGYHYADRSGNAQQSGFTQRGLVGTAGVDVAFTPDVGVGIAGAYSRGDGQFGNIGDFRADYYSGTVYGRAGLGPVRLNANATLGRVDYDAINRTVVLGPSVRTSSGKTRGDYFAARGGASLALFDMRGIGIGPEASVTYERITIDGYAESGTLSSNAAFGGQRLTSTTGRFGLLAQSTGDAPVRVAARAAYVHEFDGDDRAITITPSGAPISYTTAVARADRDYAMGGLSVDGRLGGALTVRAGVTGEFARSGYDRIAAHAGLGLAF